MSADKKSPSRSKRDGSYCSLTDHPSENRSHLSDLTGVQPAAMRFDEPCPLRRSGTAAMTQTPDNTVLALYPPRAPEATTPVVGAHYGVPKHAYDLKPMGLTIKVDPLLTGTLQAGDVIRLVLNGHDTEATKIIAAGEENAIQTLYLPKGLLRPNQLNTLVYTITRGSENKGTSTPELSLLYNAIRPGNQDRTPGDGAHSELQLILPPDVIDDGIDAERAKQGVQVCFAYPYCRAYDVIRLNCNGQDVVRTVTATEAPATPSAEPTTICVMVGEEVFQQAGDNPKFVFSYTVTDQLGNGPDTDSPYSGTVEVDVHLKETRMVAPDLAEDPDDPSDDPRTIDLTKLGSKDLTVLVHTFAPLWQPNDKIRVTYIATKPGTPMVSHTVEADVGRIPFTYKLMVPNAKVIAGSVVGAKYELVRGGIAIATSKTTTASVIGDSTAAVFVNPPYLIAPAGRLKDVVVRVGTETEPVANARVSFALPAGFSYSDGGTAERDFLTNTSGLITVSRVKGSNRPSEARLAATYANQTATAEVVIQAHGPVGRVGVGSQPYVVAVSHDGTRAYVTCPRANSICVIDTLTNRPATYFNIGKRCDYVAVSLDDTLLYVSNLTSATVSFVDTSTGDVVRTVNTAPNPAHITLNSNGTELHVSHETTTTVSLINTATGSVRPVAVAERPQGGAFSTDGKLLYVCIYYPQFLISIIDTENQRVIENIPVSKGAWTCVLSPDNRYLYVAHVDTYQVSVIDTASRRVLRSLTFDFFVMHIVISADGAFLYVSLWQTQKVAVIDTATFAIRYIPAAGYLRGLAITPDNTRLYVCDAGNDGSTVEVLQAVNSATADSAFGLMSLPELEYQDPHSNLGTDLFNP
jgi:YVTN family beta-propeller protein